MMILEFFHIRIDPTEAVASLGEILCCSPSLPHFFSHFLPWNLLYQIVFLIYCYSALTFIEFMEYMYSFDSECL